MKIIKKFKGLLALTAVLALMNTVAFAATNTADTKSSTTTYSTSFTVSCNLTDYNCSSETACKEDAYDNTASLTNLSGASMAYSYQFLMKVASPSSDVLYTKVGTYTYKVSSLTLTYSRFSAGTSTKYAVYAMLYGYPYSSTAPVSGTVTP